MSEKEADKGHDVFLMPRLQWAVAVQKLEFFLSMQKCNCLMQTHNSCDMSQMCIK